jgi:hypothetical protein
MDRFKEQDESPGIVTWCEECGEIVHVGGQAVRTVEDIVLHDECERAYLQRFYIAERGTIALAGVIE